MFRSIRLPTAVLIAVLAVLSCGKSATAPKPPPELPNDPNANAPGLAYVNHFLPDTQWIDLTPTTDDVEIKNIKLYFQMDPNSAWSPMGTRLNGDPIVRRNTVASLEVVAPQFGHAPYAATLTLSLRRTPYRTWFRVKVY